ncbi:phage major capsid protein [Paraburkholderia sediminicola]|uniref:phage major capsid protein n=1 Tax=Paraburkholderia sediminicola TaxID=458836 RepID=UPI0038B852C9
MPELIEDIRKALEARDAPLQTWLDKASADLEKLKADSDTHRVNLLDLGQKMAGLGEPMRRGGGDLQSLGALLSKSLLEKWDGGNGSPRVKVALDLNTKAVLSTQADAANGYPVAPQQQLVTPIILPYFWSGLASVPTTSNAIEVVRAVFTNAAAPVAEGVLKPESTNTFSSDLSPVVTVPTWKQASKQVLDDVPQLSAFIDTELRDAVNQTVDAQVLAGSGTGGNLLGLMKGGTEQDGSGAQTNRLDTVLNAVAALQAKGAQKVVVGLNPADIIGMVTMKDANGGYILNPLAPLTGVLGASFVPSAAVPVGQYCAVATPQGAYVGLRQGITVEISREDRDNFIRNLVTILAECRLALVIQRPDLVLYGSLVGTPPVGNAKS